MISPLLHSRPAALAAYIRRSVMKTNYTHLDVCFRDHQ